MRRQTLLAQIVVDLPALLRIQFDAIIHIDLDLAAELVMLGSRQPQGELYLFPQSLSWVCHVCPSN